MCAFLISFRGNPFSPYCPHDPYRSISRVPAEGGQSSSCLYRPHGPNRSTSGLLSSGEPFLRASDLPGFVGPDSIRMMSFDLADFFSIGKLSLLAPSVEPNPSDSELHSDSDASEANNMRFSNSFPGESFLPGPASSTPFLSSNSAGSLSLGDLFLLVDSSVVDNAAIVSLVLSIPSVEFPSSTDVVPFPVGFSF